MSQILGSNSYIKITSSVFDYNAAYTVLLHYRVDTAPTGDYATIISISNDGEAALSDTDIYQINPFSSPKVHRINVKSNSSGSTPGGSAAVTATTWYNPVMIRTASNAIRGYLGSATETSTATNNMSGRSAQTNFVLGAVLGSGGASQYTVGTLHSCKIWTTSLTTTELDDEKVQVEPVKTSSLYGWWFFDNSSDKWVDRSGNGHNFTLVGTSTYTSDKPSGVTEPAGNQSVSVSATTGALTLIGQSATVQAGSVSVSTTAGTLTLSGNTATITVGSVSVSASTSSLALTGNQASIVTGAVTVNGATGTLTLTGQTATVSISTRINASTGALTLTGQSASIVAGAVTVNGQLGTLTLSGNTASIVAGSVSVSASTGTLSLVGNSATVVAGAVVVSAITGALTLTSNQASIVPGTVAISATTGTLTLSGLTADVLIAALLDWAVVVSAITGALTLTSNQASIVPGTVAISATTGTLTLSGLTADVLIAALLDWTVSDSTLHSWQLADAAQYTWTLSATVRHEWTLSDSTR